MYTIKESVPSELTKDEQEIVKKIGRDNADYCVVAIIKDRHFKNETISFNENNNELIIEDIKIQIPPSEEILKLEDFHKVDAIAEYIYIISEQIHQELYENGLEK